MPKKNFPGNLMNLQRFPRIYLAKTYVIPIPAGTYTPADKFFMKADSELNDMIVTGMQVLPRNYYNCPGNALSVGNLASFNCFIFDTNDRMILNNYPIIGLFPYQNNYTNITSIKRTYFKINQLTSYFSPNFTTVFSQDYLLNFQIFSDKIR